MRRAAGPAAGSRPPSRRGRSRSACIANGRLRHTGKDPVQHAPPCVVSRVGFSVLQTSSTSQGPAVRGLSNQAGSSEHREGGNVLAGSRLSTIEQKLGRGSACRLFVCAHRSPTNSSASAVTNTCPKDGVQLSQISTARSTPTCFVLAIFLRVGLGSYNRLPASPHKAMGAIGAILRRSG